MPAGAVPVAGLAGRRRQVGSAGIRQGAGRGGQWGKRQGHGLRVRVVLWMSPVSPYRLSLSRSSAAHLEQSTGALKGRKVQMRNTAGKSVTFLVFNLSTKRICAVLWQHLFHYKARKPYQILKSIFINIPIIRLNLKYDLLFSVLPQPFNGYDLVIMGIL